MTAKPRLAIRAFLDQPLGDQAFVLWVLVLLVVVEVGTRVLSLPALARIMGIALDWESPVQEVELRATPRLTPRERRRVFLAHRVCATWPGRSCGPCLRESLALGAVLRRRRPRLRIGVKRNDGDVLAHAWLEVAGGCLLAEGSYLPLVAADTVVAQP